MRQPSKARVLRDQISFKLRQNSRHILATAVAWGLPGSSFIEETEDGKTLVLVYGPGGAPEANVVNANRVLLAETLAELTDPDKGTLGVRAEVHA